MNNAVPGSPNLCILSFDGAFHVKQQRYHWSPIHFLPESLLLDMSNDTNSIITVILTIYSFHSTVPIAQADPIIKAKTGLSFASDPCLVGKNPLEILNNAAGL